MRWLLPLFVLLLIISGCETHHDKAEKGKFHIKNKNTNKQRLHRYIEFEVFKDGESIGNCSYKIKMTQTVIGNDTLWLVTTVNPAVAKGPGFYFYESLSQVSYIKSKEGYDIELTLEAQLAESNSELTRMSEQTINFVTIYDALQDNFRSGNEQDTLNFKENGTTCSKGNFIQLRKILLITQHGNELKFRGSKLEVNPSLDYTAPYRFIETNDFPKTMKFEKTAGYRPVNIIRKNSDGNEWEKTSKYDSSGVFGKNSE